MPTDYWWIRHLMNPSFSANFFGDYLSYANAMFLSQWIWLFFHNCTQPLPPKKCYSTVADESAKTYPPKGRNQSLSNHFEPKITPYPSHPPLHNPTRHLTWCTPSRRKAQSTKAPLQWPHGWSANRVLTIILNLLWAWTFLLPSTVSQLRKQKIASPNHVTATNRWISCLRGTENQME
jgi:hypothetical protein